MKDCFISDARKVYSTIRSCKKLEQFDICEKMIENFIAKHNATELSSEIFYSFLEKNRKKFEPGYQLEFDF